MGAQGMTRDDQQFYTEALVGRKLSTLDEITKGEASTIITDLKK
jgi:hypothetical protein